MKFRHHILKGSKPSDLNCDFPNTILKRYFLSSPSQIADFPDEDGAVGYIVQPPLDGSACALWVLEAEGADGIERRPGVTEVRDGENLHIFHAGIIGNGGGSEAQTRSILEGYEDTLEKEYGISFAEECVRTWFFCDDIDNEYAGLVKARRENFTELGLTPKTHYIASTGICGKPAVPGKIVQMDAWAVKGPLAASQRYLYAPTHLNPTYEYGVTFERGVRVGDFTVISGTASIDNKGAVLHVGDIVKQTYRMWENVGKLLEEGGSQWSDVGSILVYLRRPEDYEVVSKLFAERFPSTPFVILLAPVCRPDWLIEMECIA